jgi:hypothetical protein
VIIHPSRQQSHAAAENVDRRTRIIDRRGQRPRGDLGQHRKAETRILIKRAQVTQREALAQARLSGLVGVAFKPE